jgi:RimJ/RimL family protein N-acetyltransferase
MHMDLQDFVTTHLPALERDEARFGVLIGMLTVAAANASPELTFWTLGVPGRCAALAPERSIVLGELDAGECRQLAQAAIGVAAGGVLGDGDKPHWFAAEAARLGVKLGEPIPQRIHILRQPPRHPQAAGAARPTTSEDAPLLYAWLTAFQREATPHTPPPSREGAGKAARSGRYLLWTVDGQPVAMGAINRRLRQTGSIGAVYTLPEHRNRGYAGAVTAALADRILADGKTAACLYTDLRNPVSNRCYAGLGFVPYCDAWHYPPAGKDA